MTKYLVFENQPSSGQSNAPGSREEMACTIAQFVMHHAKPRNFYIAYPLENPHASWESVKASAKFSVEIDDERAELWENEISHLADLANEVGETISNAYSAIVKAARAFDDACKHSDRFRDVKVLREMGIDQAFDAIENSPAYEVYARVESVFEIESFHHFHA